MVSGAREGAGQGRRRELWRNATETRTRNVRSLSSLSILLRNIA